MGDYSYKAAYITDGYKISDDYSTLECGVAFKKFYKTTADATF